MTLKLSYLPTTRIFAWIRLAGRDTTAKNVEILMLRHRLAVAQRRDPHLARRLTWADQAWLTLLAGLLPHSRLPRIRLIVTPGTVLRWHRDFSGSPERTLPVSEPSATRSGWPGHAALSLGPQRGRPHPTSEITQASRNASWCQES